jgi:hypothetical protein
MDRQKLAELIAKIDAVCKSQDKETVLTLDEYFDGNTEEHSTLCANNGKPPSSEELWRFLRGIQDKKEVSQVLVRVYDYCDAIEYGDCWINADTVFVVTTASVDAVGVWFTPLQCTDIFEETDLTTFNNFPSVPHGFRVVGVWWD